MSLQLLLGLPVCKGKTQDNRRENDANQGSWFFNTTNCRRLVGGPLAELIYL